ncbi:hypothetical protein HMPREF9413_5619 [Paenibacillus sp. HGF7]|nr:hypothetical protein HMPREF9413_5619 [Paenibacillus sp. HGF7]
MPVVFRLFSSAARHMPVFGPFPPAIRQKGFPLLKKKALQACPGL